MTTSTRFTYKEWLAKGYQVQRGEKHTGRNETGECTFHKGQVKRTAFISSVLNKPKKKKTPRVSLVGWDLGNDDDNYEQLLSSEEMDFRDSDYCMDMGDR